MLAHLARLRAVRALDLPADLGRNVHQNFLLRLAREGAQTAVFREQLAQGSSMQQAIALVAVAEKPHWLLWDSTHPHNVARVYEQLEWE